MGDFKKVVFEPGKKTIKVRQGSRLDEVARDAGLELETVCGGSGKCGKCKVLIADGAGKPTVAERSHLSSSDLEQGYRLACSTIVDRDMRVILPEQSLAAKEKGRFKGPEPDLVPEPALRKEYLQLSPPDLEDQASDSERLRRCFRGQRSKMLPLSVYRKLPGVLREENFRVTVIKDGCAIRGVEAGNTVSINLGVAIDIGTTTVAGYLYDLASGKLLSEAAVLNAQAARGADLISRIDYIRRDEKALPELQALVLGSLNELLRILVREVGLGQENIYVATVVGNTCMQHIFLGISPASLAASPYVAAIKEGVSVDPGEVGLLLNRAGRIFVLPNIAGFVGSDAVSMILGTGMDRSGKINLAVDIGTNGEVVVGGKEKLLACSAAAGPAFEGAQISRGMRAAEGAIDRVFFDQRLKYSVIGGGEPVGICGSGLIDAVAVLLDRGLVNHRGKILSAGEPVAKNDSQLAGRIIEHEGANAFVLAESPPASGRDPILITQGDIRELQLAKAAIATGITVICKEYGIATDDIDAVFLAGAFGNYMNQDSAVRIGLLPPELKGKITHVGNAAGVGAARALISRREIDRADQVAGSVGHVELASYPGFYKIFAGHVNFPS